MSPPLARSNVLISRDYRKCRIIDIDGNSQGSMAFDARDDGSTVIHGSSASIASSGTSAKEVSKLQMPALDIDLHSLLPLLVRQLLLGKGRGRDFADSLAQRVRNASGTSDDAAKALIRQTLRENFYPELAAESDGAEGHAGDPKRKHIQRVAEWFYALLMKRAPWQSWTNDIYDAMRCIDHLPIG
jgi:hypothetical protein